LKRWPVQNTRNDTKTLTTSWRNRHLDKLYFYDLRNAAMSVFVLITSGTRCIPPSRPRIYYFIPQMLNFFKKYSLALHCQQTFHRKMLKHATNWVILKSLTLTMIFYHGGLVVKTCSRKLYVTQLVVCIMLSSFHRAFSKYIVATKSQSFWTCHSVCLCPGENCGQCMWLSSC